MGEELGDERDPLLVRPFVLGDGVRPEPSPSRSTTWPAQTGSGEQATQLLPAVPAGASADSESGRSARWRPLVLIGAGVVAVAGIAGYALLRPADEPGEWVAEPGQSLPAAIGPSLATSDSEVEELPGGVAEGDAGDSGGATGSTADARTGTPTPSVSGNTPSRSVGSSPAASGAPTSATSAPPIGLLPSAIPTGRGLLANGSGLCLDLRGGRAAEGQDVHVDDCNGTSPQRWRLNSERTLEVLDMCAYLVGDGTVELTRCDERTTAQWRLFTNGTLVNASNGLCLTDPHSGTRPANAVIVTVCTGGRNQSWTFR